MANARVIAYYLPQFHPNPENDKWWGKGFTEWTNVGKAKSLFPGHKQPKIPSDLGYYDLRVEEVRIQQAELAKQAGVEGFCYWHYWFGDGEELLDMPFKEVVANGKPDFPFCLAWANGSWYMKTWDNDASKNKLIEEQKYEGIDDYTHHFYAYLGAFKDHRYIKIDNKPLFVIYNAFDSPKVKDFMECWNELSKKEGFDGIYWIAHCLNDSENAKKYQDMGFEAVNIFDMNGFDKHQNLLYRILNKAVRMMFKWPKMVKFDFAAKYMNKKIEGVKTIPTILCGWDHTPRSGRKGCVMTDYTPKTFGKHIKDALSYLENNGESYSNLVFLKSWNEWGEGNFMEPEMEYGTAFIDVLRTELTIYSDERKN